MDLNSNNVQEELDRYADEVLNMYSKPTATLVEKAEEVSRTTTQNQNPTITELVSSTTSTRGNTSNNNSESTLNIQDNGQNLISWNQNFDNGSNVSYGGNQSFLPYYTPTHNPSFNYNYNPYYPPPNYMYPQAPISPAAAYYQQYASNAFNNNRDPRIYNYQNWNFQPPYQNTARYVNPPPAGPTSSNANVRETRIANQIPVQDGPSTSANEGDDTCVADKNKTQKGRPWSKRQDEALLKWISKFTVNGNIFWDGVFSNYKDRTKLQIFYRYKALMKEKEKKKQKAPQKVTATRK